MKGNESISPALLALAVAAARASRVLVVAVVLLTVACTGGSDQPLAVKPTVDLVEPTTSTGIEDTDATDPEVSPTADPTSTSPSATDADRIDAAIAALNSSGVGDLGAWDVLDSAADEDGIVTLTLCGWTGDTVFDGVYRSLWRTELASGMLVASELGTSPTSGECLNTELIESALETFRVHDAYWFEVLNDPASFEDRPESALLFTDRQYAIAQEATAKWAADGLTVKHSPDDQSIDTDLVTDLLWRRYRRPTGEAILEFATCRELDPDYGVYRGTTLIDDEKSGDDGGTHSIGAYLFVASPDQPLSWRVAERHALNWGECVSGIDWPVAASTWRPAETNFAPLQQS